MADVETAPVNFNPNFPAWIAVTVKSGVDRKDIVVQDNKTVEQFKSLIAKELNVAKEQLCLVFHSTTLDSHRTLRQCGIEEGSIVRVVVRTVRETPDEKASQNQTDRKAEVEASPFGLDALGGLPGLVDLGFGSANFADVQLRIQKKLYSDPALLKSLLGNPLVKDIMSRPDLYSQLVASNPCVVELVQESPEMTEVLGNPILTNQMMTLAAQPKLMKELIDPKYKELINPRVYRDESEPTAKRPKLEKENCEGATDREAPENDRREDEENKTGGHLNEGRKVDATEGLLRQMIDRPKEVAGMLQAPYVQLAINFAANNPEYLRLMMNHIPGVDDSEALKKQLDLALPYFAQQLANPEVHSLMCNPRALQAMLDIQEGMRELQEEVPGYFGYSKSENDNEKDSEVLNQVLSSVTSHVSDLPDEEKYAVQLSQLGHMGFTDREENLKVLVLAGGDINAAIIHHLQNQQTNDYHQGLLGAYPPHLQSIHGSVGSHHLLLDEQQQQAEAGQVDADQSHVERLLLLEGEGADVEAEATLALDAQVKSEQ